MILDTNALSAFADGSLSIVAALTTTDDLAVPVIVLGEFRYGVAHSTRIREYETWLDKYLSTFRVLDVTVETAVEYSLLRSELRRLGKPIPADDVWIAALCRQHNLPLLSRDTHFDNVKRLRRHAW